MASKSLAFILVLGAAICSLLLLIVFRASASPSADCKVDSGPGCFVAEGAVSLGSAQNRKMGAAGLKENTNVEFVDVEFRRVPSGPDPLHHNGNLPKKPRTDP